MWTKQVDKSTQWLNSYNTNYNCTYLEQTQTLAGKHQTSKYGEKKQQQKNTIFYEEEAECNRPCPSWVVA